MITIEKRISLEFLGDEYADSYVVMQAIPMKDYEDIQNKTEAIQESGDNHAAMKFMVDLLTERFIRGEIKQGDKLEPVKAEDLAEMPGEFFMGVMERMTGQSPKA